MIMMSGVTDIDQGEDEVESIHLDEDETDADMLGETDTVSVPDVVADIISDYAKLDEAWVIHHFKSHPRQTVLQAS